MFKKYVVFFKNLEKSSLNLSLYTLPYLYTKFQLFKYSSFFCAFPVSQSVVEEFYIHVDISVT